MLYRDGFTTKHKHAYTVLLLRFRNLLNKLCFFKHPPPRVVNEIYVQAVARFKIDGNAEGSRNSLM